MSEVDETPRSYSGALLAAIAVALLAGLGGLIWSYYAQQPAEHRETALTEAKQQNVKLAAELRETDARLKVATEELGNSLGLTQKQMDARAAGDHPAGGGRRSSTAGERTEADRAAGERRLQRSVECEDRRGRSEDRSEQDAERTGHHDRPVAVDEGRFDGHSSLIARNHDELELLKHKGDRNYYEFTLTKGQRKPVGTVSLELKKADPKKNTIQPGGDSDDKTVRKERQGT